MFTKFSILWTYFLLAFTLGLVSVRTYDSAITTGYVSFSLLCSLVFLKVCQKIADVDIF